MEIQDKLQEAWNIVEQTERRKLKRSDEALEMDHFLALANEARRDYEDAAHDYIVFAKEESKLESERPSLLDLIKARIMNDLPSVAATNAEKMARIDHEYLKHLALQRDTVAIKDNHRTRMESAKMRCKTANAYLNAMGG